LEKAMGFALKSLLVSTTIAGGMLVFLELGRRIGLARIARNGRAEEKVFGSVEAALFGLLGLVVALSFSGAASRLDARRQLVAAEANAIGTAWLRTDLLPGEARHAVRDQLRRYLDVRIETYREMEDEAGTRRRLAVAASLQRELWDLSAAACRREGAAPQATLLLLPAVNAVIDIATTREAATLMHPPREVYILLAVLSLAASLLAGHGMASSHGRSWLHFLAFAFMVGVTFYVILELEFPRKGLVRIDSGDRVLASLRESMR
jgi:hypothetical protein